jgi:hypothetical protein
MKRIFSLRRHHYLAKARVFLIVAALAAGMAGCNGGGGIYNPIPSQNLEIWDWYDLDDVRDNLAGNHTLMNDLDSTTAGYEELASPTANSGKGWQPIGYYNSAGGFVGIFDGQGYEIRNLFINRPDEEYVGLFGVVSEHCGQTKCEGVIKNIGVVNAAVTGNAYVGALVGYNDGTVSNSYSTGNVTGPDTVGGLGGQNGGTVNKCYSGGNVTGCNGTSGNITGGSKIGGLLGENYGEINVVSNSYSMANVTGDENVGGLVGYNAFATISKCYSTGNVTGGIKSGGLVGGNYLGDVYSSFWDIKTSGHTTSYGGMEEGKTTSEMQEIATFLGAGWNIVAVALNETNPAYIWNIPTTPPDYPFLSWQPV